MSEATSHRESDEAYKNVICTSTKYRVIVNRCGIQWIIQRRSGESSHGAAWRSISYCTTRKGLIREWHVKTGDYHGAVTLGHLPSKLGGADE